VLANAAKLGEAADSAEQMLYGGDAAIIDAVSRAHARLLDAAAIDPKLNEASELIETARANLEEAARSLRAYADRVEADPARLEEIEARLQELTRLKRKYGGSIESALDTLERSRAEITELESAGEDRAAAEREFNALVEDLFARADSLSAARRENASELKLRIEGELKTLGMRNASFETHFEHADENESSILANGRALGPLGFDSVEFYIAPNLGQPAMPLARIASGGELSRVMLALKRLEAQRRGVATLIFDEVDAGIGGAVAEIVGRKLKQLAKFHQVLCVTHLPQIAAFADSHFVVEKEERRGSTRSRVIALELSDRPGEIARMIGGDGSSGKLLHAARELLQRARA
jgi:DNA repair protein RecN (Recombination protein N)